MIDLPEEELARLRELVLSGLEGHELLRPSTFLDNLIVKTLRRYRPLQRALDALDEVEEGGEPPPPPTLSDLVGGVEAAAAFSEKELRKASQSPYYPLVQDVALTGKDEAVQALMKTLDSHLKLRGIVFRYRLDPDEEYPALWSRVWEAIPKWDGRDFRAYVARIVRNHCLDEIARRKKAPMGMEADPREARPGRGQTGAAVSSRDALDFVGEVLDELEASGRIKALDGVIFGLIGQSRSVADIVEAFRHSDVLSRFAAAFERLGGECSEDDVIPLQLLVEGMTAAEVAMVVRRDEAQIAAVAEALGDLAADTEQLIAKVLIRPGLRVKDLERAQRLTTNAINLCINRIRLKVWMAVVDRAYESLRRRGAIDDVGLAIVQERCAMAPPSGCRMYKDHTCKREVDPDDIARRGGLDLDGPAVSSRMKALRLKVVEEGLGLVFPDYNACLIERKPIRKKKTS